VLLLLKMVFACICPEKFREIYNFAFGWAKEKVLFSLRECLDLYILLTYGYLFPLLKMKTS